MLKSKPISQSITAGSSGYIEYTVNGSAPSEYTLVAKQFRRTDAGGYYVTITSPLYARYILFLSHNAAPTLTGYVIELYIKGVEY